ncbi:MAG: helix-turn-helix domain-containing protein [Trueperaceae bacterium]|nr:helix-turn-helix domain-containing protein [Trueperaceae bacterium]
MSDVPTVHAGAHDPSERASADERRDGRGPIRLGHLLREARERAGLGLSDVAEVTHVRRNYLDALEEGRYGDLPEDVYTRNFLRLYAQAVSLDVDEVVELYLRERRTAGGLTTLEQRLERDRRAVTPSAAGPFDARAPGRGGPPEWLLGPWLPTLVLVVIVVGIGLWGFNQLITPAARSTATPSGAPSTPAAAPVPPSPAPAESGAAAAAPGGGLAPPVLGGPGGSAAVEHVRVDVITTPPGASVTIDTYPIPGVTPHTAVLYTASDARVVRAELDGYQSTEVIVDLSTDARVELVLTPIGATSPEIDAAVPAGGEGALTITVNDTTWLEIYRSTQRNVGERLVYTTVQGGASFTYGPPLYVYVGNAAGVRISRNGQDLGAMGSPGAVLGRAFPE